MEPGEVCRFVKAITCLRSAGRALLAVTLGGVVFLSMCPSVGECLSCSLIAGFESESRYEGTAQSWFGGTIEVLKGVTDAI